MPHIRLHPEHGLNPTIAKCFWCNEPKNEILLLGAQHNGRRKIPARAAYSVQPYETGVEERKSSWGNPN